MSEFVWIATIFLMALVFWAGFSVALHRIQTVDEAILSTFKLMLRHRDIDPGAIPDAALIDIIVIKIDAAKRVASEIEVQGKPTGDWRRHLVRLLDQEADVIEIAIRQGSHGQLQHASVRLLLKYGAIEPREQSMSAEEFTDAARLGTLYAELERRVSSQIRA